MNREILLEVAWREISRHIHNVSKRRVGLDVAMRDEVGALALHLSLSYVERTVREEHREEDDQFLYPASWWDHLKKSVLPYRFRYTVDPDHDKYDCPPVLWRALRIPIRYKAVAQTIHVTRHVHCCPHIDFDPHTAKLCIPFLSGEEPQ